MEFEKLNSMMKLKDLTNLIQDKVHTGGVDQKCKNSDLSNKPINPVSGKIQMYDYLGKDVKLSVKTESARVNYAPRYDIYDVMTRVCQDRGMLESASRAIFTSVGSATANDAKYMITRNGKEYEVEVYFPNENGNITVRIECDGVERIREFSADEDRNLAKHVNEIADSIFRDQLDKTAISGGSLKDALKDVIGSGYNDNDEYSKKKRAAFSNIPDEGLVSANPLKFESAMGANIRAFDNAVFNRVRSLFEADSEKTPEENTAEQPPESQADVSPGDVNSTSAVDDGSLDMGSSGDLPGSDLGSLGGGGSLGGLPDDAYSVHGQDGPAGALADSDPNGNYDPDTIYGQLMTRYVPTPEGMSIPFVNGMVYLISQVNYESSVQNRLTPSQMSRGFSGLNGEAKPAVIINQFFDMFPSFKNLPLDGRFEGAETGSSGVNFIQACEQAPENGYNWFKDVIGGLYNKELGLTDAEKAAFGSKDEDLFSKAPEIPSGENKDSQSPENAFPGLQSAIPGGDNKSGYGDLFGAAQDFNKVAQEQPPEESKKI